MFFGKKGSLIDMLPKVEGSYVEDVPMSDLTWFGVGGPAEVLYRPNDELDLQRFLIGKPYNVHVTLVGVGSNLLVRDGGIPGVVIRLGPPFASVRVDGDLIHCGAACLDTKIAKVALREGLGGFEFLGGIPGTIGGAIKMNAGSFSREIKDVLVKAIIIDGSGNRYELDADELRLAYRSSLIPNDWIITSAILRGYKEDPAIIKKKMNDYKEKRETAQPLKAKTAGSTFKNPEGLQAWKLIERAGCRGLRVGGAMISEKHCNFIVNVGDATANDIETLGEEVRRRVKEATSIDLEWEVRRIGVKTEKDSSFGGRY